MSISTFEPVTTRVGQLSYAVKMALQMGSYENVAMIKHYYDQSRAFANSVIAKHSTSLMAYHCIYEEIPRLGFTTQDFTSVQDLILELSFKEHVVGVIFTPDDEDRRGWRRCIAIVGHGFTTPQSYILMDIGAGSATQLDDLDNKVKRYLGPGSYTFVALREEPEEPEVIELEPVTCLGLDLAPDPILVPEPTPSAVDPISISAAEGATAGESESQQETSSKKTDAPAKRVRNTRPKKKVDIK